MTYTEARDEFRKYLRPKVVQDYGENDKPAMREAWNNYVDWLHRSSLITAYQYNTWAQPKFGK